MHRALRTRVPALCRASNPGNGADASHGVSFVEDGAFALCAGGGVVSRRPTLRANPPRFPSRLLQAPFPKSSARSRH